MNTTVWILVAAFAILLLMNLKVFFFQRTIRKVHLKTGTQLQMLNVAYPSAYMTMYYLSFLRYAAIIVMFFFSWKIAAVCLIVNFLLPAVLPEQSDYKNLQKAKKVIAGKMVHASTEQKELLSYVDILIKEIIDNEYVTNKNIT